MKEKDCARDFFKGFLEETGDKGIFINEKGEKEEINPQEEKND